MILQLCCKGRFFFNLRLLLTAFEAFFLSLYSVDAETKVT